MIGCGDASKNARLSSSEVVLLYLSLGAGRAGHVCVIGRRQGHPRNPVRCHACRIQSCIRGGRSPLALGTQTIRIIVRGSAEKVWT